MGFGWNPPEVEKGVWEKNCECNVYVYVCVCVLWATPATKRR